MIQINSDWKFGLDQSELGLIRNENLVFDWFGFIRIGSDIDIGMNRNNSDWLGINSYPILSPGILHRLTIQKDTIKKN